MEAKENKKEFIRRQIISAAEVYKTELAGKVFLYVYGEEYFELNFRVDSFFHLTGVDSTLKAKQFYEYAKDGHLTNEQFYFTQQHYYNGAKKKLTCLSLLPVLTNSLVCILKDLTTVTLTYKIGVTNLDFTLGLTQNVDKNGKILNEMFFPRTLRVSDHSIEKSRDGEFVDFILMRNASVSKYDTIMYRDNSKKLPESVNELIDERILKIFRKE